MYKTVYDLSKEELDELREAYFNQLVDCGDNDEIGFSCSHDIEDAILFEHYDGMTFCEDDFL